MKTGKIIWCCLTGVLVVSTVGLFIVRLNYGKVQVQHQMSAATVRHQSMTEESKVVEYHIRHVFPSTRSNRFATIIVSVDPRHFNRDDMTTLASHLKREFAQEIRVKAVLLDDDNVARNIVPGGAENSIFEEAQRGLYYLDRAKCKEYIQFSPRRGKPRETIRFKCQRQQR